MGCFDYTCECGGDSCEHVGGQLHDSEVYIQVPLSDGTTIYLTGHYEEYGYVSVKMPIAADVQYIDYKFYLKEFEQFFQGWFDGEDQDELEDNLLATKVWTKSETTYAEDRFGSRLQSFVERHCFDEMDVTVSELTPEIVSKCKRAIEGLTIVTKEEAKKKRIDYLKAEIKKMNAELKRLDSN